MLRVPADPLEILLGAHPTFVLKAKVPHVEGVFVVGQVAPKAGSGGLIEGPMRAVEGGGNEVHTDPTVPHLHGEHRQPVFLDLADLHPSKAFGMAARCIMEQASLA